MLISKLIKKIAPSRTPYSPKGDSPRTQCGGVLPPGGVRGVRVGTILSLVLLSFLLSGCADFFKPEDYSLSNIQSYEQLEQAMEGITCSFKIYASSEISYKSSIFGDDLLSFDLSHPTTSVSWEYYAVFKDPYSRPLIATEDFKFELPDWHTYYTLIASVNNALIQFDLDKTKDQATRELLGEFYFYRAYFYYRLTHIYGRIPLIDNIDVDYTVKRSTYSEIYEFIEADLLQAIQLLPANKIDSRMPNESPNRGAAKALLGEVYLNWAGFPAKDDSKYTLAMQLTGEVIDSAVYFGFELLPDFEDLWNSKSYYNNEGVFCNYHKHERVIPYYYLYKATLELDPTKFNRGGFGTDPNSTIKISDNLIPEIEFYNQYPKGYRKDITFFTSIYVHPNEYFHKLDTGYVNVATVESNSRAAFRKFFLDTAVITETYTYSDRTFVYNYVQGCQRIYLLRYAQTLLTYAEASARAGKLDDKAYECLNKVRRRANHLPLDAPSPFDLQPGLSVEAFVDSVVQERAWEFAGEQGYRWYDMVRTQSVEKVYAKKDPADVNVFKYSENDRYFFPIPQKDINLSPNWEE